MIDKAELERLAERVNEIVGESGSDKAELRAIERELRALAARCDQPAGEPGPLPGPAHYIEGFEYSGSIGKHRVRIPCYTADQLRTHREEYAERVAAPRRERLAELERASNGDTFPEITHEQRLAKAHCGTRRGNSADARAMRLCAELASACLTKLGEIGGNYARAKHRAETAERERDEARTILKFIRPGFHVLGGDFVTQIWWKEKDENGKNKDRHVTVREVGPGAVLSCLSAAIDSAMGDDKTATVADDVAAFRKITNSIEGKS